MQLKTLREFLQTVIVENLHPELKAIAHAPTGATKTSKLTQLSNKIKELTKRGESTGIEGNMPRGSSRAYLPLEERQKVNIDGKDAHMKTGMKVAIRSPLDSHHDKKKYDGMSLGHMQNEAEGGDHYLNNNHRILTQHENGRYTTNEHGIFPPLIDHDHDNHEWSHVGHVDSVKASDFRNLTKTESHPKGISHEDFTDSLRRSWDKDHGKYWHQGDKVEKELDHIESHPLVQKFLDHQRLYGMPPHDYGNIKNLGAWTHPGTGQKHIVARDHGFSENVMKAYRRANEKKYKF